MWEITFILVVGCNCRNIIFWCDLRSQFRCICVWDCLNDFMNAVCWHRLYLFNLANIAHTRILFVLFFFLFGKKNNKKIGDRNVCSLWHLFVFFCFSIVNHIFSRYIAKWDVSFFYLSSDSFFVFFLVS